MKNRLDRKDAENIFAHITNLKSAQQLLVDRENEIIEQDEKIDKIEAELKKSLAQISELIKRIKVQNNRGSQTDLSKIEVHTSEIFETVLDISMSEIEEDDESSVYYYQIPNKSIANELLIDSGNAIVDGIKVRVHLEIVG